MSSFVPTCPVKDASAHGRGRLGQSAHFVAGEDEVGDGEVLLQTVPFRHGQPILRQELLEGATKGQIQPDPACTVVCAVLTLVVGHIGGWLLRPVQLPNVLREPVPQSSPDPQRRGRHRASEEPRQ